jgi:hypothetical protein
MNRGRWQRVIAAIDEGDPSARDQVRHRPRDQHFAGRGVREDLGGHVHGDSAELPAVQLALAGVKAGPAPYRGPVALRDDRLRAADGARGPVEGCAEGGPASGEHLAAEWATWLRTVSARRSLADAS